MYVIPIWVFQWCCFGDITNALYNIYMFYYSNSLTELKMCKDLSQQIFDKWLIYIENGTHIYSISLRMCKNENHKWEYVW